MPYINVWREVNEVPGESQAGYRANKKDFELVKDLGMKVNRNPGKLFGLSYFL